MYYTMIKHDGYLRTRGKCKKHEPQASVFYISRVLSNVRSVLSQCNRRLRLLHLLYDIEGMWRKTIKHAFSMFYTPIKHGFLTNQSARTILSIIYITELRILDFQHFHWLAGHRLSAHIRALPNMVNESINKKSWIKIFSRNWRPLKIV